MKNTPLSQTVTVCDQDEEVAVAKIAEALEIPDIAGIIFFVSPKYDIEKAVSAINQHFSCNTIGCSTAGEIGPEYVDGIIAIALSGSAFKLHTLLLDLENGISSDDIKTLTNISNHNSEFTDEKIGCSSLGFLLIDGLSMKEEASTALLHESFPHIPLIGGSAGDGEAFGTRYVFHNDEIRSNTAVFSFIETNLDFETFKLQHFEPSETEFIVTEADPLTRTVQEFDGEPAAQYFAESIGLSVEDFSLEVFSLNPLMLEIGNDWYVRSCTKANADGSLLFSCAIDAGVPLTIGKSIGIEGSLRAKIDELKEKYSSIELTIGCDCILRRIEILNSGKEKIVSNMFREINFVGFSTYGEQFNSLHVNQTLTGVIFGKRKTHE